MIFGPSKIRPPGVAGVAFRFGANDNDDEVRDRINLYSSLGWQLSPLGFRSRNTSPTDGG